MIKLNLLPRYLLEIRRLKIMSVIFGIIFAAVCGVILKAHADLKSQAAWFAKDKLYYQSYKREIETAKAAADAISVNAAIYPEFNKFFTRGPAQDHADAIAERIVEAVNAVSGQKAWFTTMRIEKSDVTLTGEIQGLMNFVNYYFHLKGNNFSVAPAAQPYPASPVNQVISLNVTGKLSAPLPEPKGPPSSTPAMANWSDLYKGANP